MKIARTKSTARPKITVVQQQSVKEAPRRTSPFEKEIIRRFTEANSVRDGATEEAAAMSTQASVDESMEQEEATTSGEKDEGMAGEEEMKRSIEPEEIRDAWPKNTLAEALVKSGTITRRQAVTLRKQLEAELRDDLRKEIEADVRRKVKLELIKLLSDEK